MKEIQHAMVRLANTSDGRKVLEHIKSRTLNRTLGPDASTQELWYLEGQRALIAYLDNLIEQGKKE
ncbi:MAG: hypothetical protein IKQ99_00105 [Alphaproteobacteria bacterium]|nr:hypothetical protein [Alphaproteobacteria bacterium]